MHEFKPYIKFTQDEIKVAEILFNHGKVLNARTIAAFMFEVTNPSVDQKQIRAVRNAFRKLVREGLIVAEARGYYRTTEKFEELKKSGSLNEVLSENSSD